MTDHLPMSPLAFAKADEYVFARILDPALPFLRALGTLPLMVTDSSAVRAYTGKCRWMGDIDLLVLHDSPTAILELMQQHFDRVIIGSRGGFFRAQFDVPTEGTGLAEGTGFLIDIHVNAIFHHGKPTVVVPEEEFARVEWAFVPSVGGHRCCRLPVPSLRTILSLKARKDVGNDLLDVFVLLSFADINPAWLSQDFLKPAIQDISASLDRLCCLYEIYYHEDSAFARDRFLTIISRP